MDLHLSSWLLYLYPKLLRPQQDHAQNVLTLVAQRGHTDLVDHLIKTYKLTPDETTLNWAARGGKPATIDHLAKTYNLKF